MKFFGHTTESSFIKIQCAGEGVVAGVLLIGGVTREQIYTDQTAPLSHLFMHVNCAGRPSKAVARHAVAPTDAQEFSRNASHQAHHCRQCNVQASACAHRPHVLTETASSSAQTSETK
jgi:hypothetical protein